MSKRTVAVSSWLSSFIRRRTQSLAAMSNHASAPPANKKSKKSAAIFNRLEPLEQRVLMFGSSASWTGAVSGEWNDTGNWSGGVVPGNDYSLTFPAVATTRTITITGTEAVAERLTFSATGYSFSGLTLNIDPDGDAQNGGTMGIVFSASGTGSLSFSNNINVGPGTSADTTFSADTNDTISFVDGGIISGAADLKIEGAGQINFGGGTGNVANTYTGTTSISTVSKLVAFKDAALGTTAGNTTVATGGTLAFQGGVAYATTEQLLVAGSGVSGLGALLNVSGTNSFAGQIFYGVDITIGSSAGTLTLSGAIDDASSENITKTGAGTIVFSGSNIFNGNVTVSAGTLTAAHSNALGNTTGTTTVSSGAALGVQGGITSGEPLNITGTGLGGLGVIRNVSGTNTLSGAITMAGASTLGTTAGSLALSGVITGSTTLSMVGPSGAVTLSGNSSGTFTGATTLTAGSLFVTGNIGGSSGLTHTAGILAGTGTLPAVTSSGGVIDAGTASGATSVLSLSSLSTSSGATMVFDLNGTTVSSEYDRVTVLGTVSLGNATLTINKGGSYTPAGGDTFVLVNKVSAGAITGTFNGLAEGATVSVGGVNFIISYVGGTGGNDVTLTKANSSPAITSNGGGAAAAISVPENTSAVTTVTATDSEAPPQTLTYSISGGADAAKFSINSTTGVIAFSSAPNFESPTDSGTDNVYNVTVQVSDGTATDSQNLVITVTAVNDNTPVITSNSGGSSASINVAENTTAVTTVTATDADLPAATLTYSISGGADSAKFNINSTSGVLAFIGAPNFEAPTDAGANNVYDVIVQVSDGTNTDTQNIAVTVTAVNDNTPAITSNGGGSAATINVAENTTAVTTVTATDADLPAATLTYSISGGADSGKFTINSSSGVLAFATAPNFEAPTDAGANNVYDIIVQVSDGTNTDTQNIGITVTAVNDNTPAITSNGGGTTANINVAENTTAVTTVTATDADSPAPSITYSITGGADSAKFSINGSSGVLTFNGTPNFESPTDSGANNVYDVIVQASDGVNVDAQALAVTVTNVNETPTDLALTPATVAENQSIGTIVGTLSSTDPDAGNTFTYSLVAGAGSTDNASFSITGANLKTAAIFNFLTKSTYAIRVRTTDQNGLFFDKQLTVSVTSTNTAPTDIALSNSQIAEGQAAGTTVGSFSTTDPNVGDVFTYTLVAGTGSTDNASFTIDGIGTLKSAAIFNFATKSTYAIRVRSTDQGGLFTEKEFTVSIVNSNVAPTDIALTATSIAENQSIGATVGTLSSVDPNPGNTFTYALVTGTGSTDNASFTIDGSGHLLTAASFDFETKSSYSIRIRTTDQGSLSFEEPFTITVTNVNETPTDIALSANSITENSSIGATVGSFSTTDPDSGNTFSYTLVAGDGSTDNASFTIDVSGNLTTTSIFDFETKSSYALRVRSTDQGGLSFEKQFTVSVTQLNEAPTDISLSASQIASGLAAGSTIGTFSATDADAGSTATFSLVAGTGSTDNASFTIDGSGNLKSAEVFNSLVKSSYLIRVRATDQGALTFEKQFTITISDSNAAPIDIALSASAIAENQPAGTTIGSFSSTDPNGSDTFTYSLVAGTGSTDNASFTIDGSGNLKSAGIFDFETKSSYAIRVRSTDQGALTFEKQFTITVTNANDAPTLSTIATLTGAIEDTAFTITYATLAAAADEADVDGDAISFRVETVNDGTLTKNGVPVTAGSTLIASGESLVWTPPSHFNGTIQGFTVKATDGATASTSAVGVSITVQAAGNVAPTLTTVAALSGGLEDTPFTITYAALAAAADESDANSDALSFRIESVSSGTLTKNGTPVDAGNTLISVGESLVWTPTGDANGLLEAFTVRAFDGEFLSNTDIAVNVSVTPLNDAPSLTSVTALEDAVENKAFKITYAALAAAANENDIDTDNLSFRVESVASGTLTKNGVAVVNGSTLLSTGEELVWTPPADSSGTLTMFSITAFDGSESSGTPVSVSAEVAKRYSRLLNADNKSMSYKDAAGRKITVTFTGTAGSASVIRAVPDAELGDMEELTATGTDAKTKITIAAPAKTTTNVTDINITGDLAAITASTVNVLGDVIITGAVPSVTFNDLSSNPSLSLGGTSASKASTIKLGRATGLVFTSTGPINSFTLVDWNGGSLTAPAITTFKTSGLKGVAVGDLTANINLTQADAAKSTLKSFTVTGSFIHGSLRSAGKVDSITVGTLQDTDIIVGAISTLNGIASSADDFTFKPTTANLVKLTVKGITGQPSFTDAVIDAWNIGSLDLKTVTTANSGIPLGIAADKIASLKFIAATVNSGKTVTLTKLDTVADLSSTAKNKSLVAFPIGDFNLVLL